MLADKHKDYLYMIMGGVFLVVLGVWLLAINNFLPDLNFFSKPFSKFDSQGNYVPSVLESREKLKTESPITFSDVKSEHEISVEALPKELKIFFLPGATTQAAWQIAYSDGRSGYRLSTDLSMSMSDTAQAYINQMNGFKNWNLVYGFRQEKFGAMQYQDEIYQASIEQYLDTEAHTYVEILVISK